MAGPLLSAVGAAIILVGLHHRASLTPPQQRVFLGVVLLLAAAFGLRSLDAAVDNVRDVNEFDFVGFWLHGETASRGLDFYDPQHAQRWAEGLDLSDAFRVEIVDAGFWYPPPSAFLFAPLGWVDDLQVALGAWLAVMAAALAVAIWMLWRQFLRSHGLIGLAASAALVLSAQATASTFSHGQTNFVALIAVLAAWQAQDRLAGGVWAAVAVLVKPFLAVLVVHQFVRRRWGPVLAAAGTGVVACALSIGAFGWATFAAFFSNDQVGSKPDLIYTHDTNQSLLSFIIRTADIDIAGRSPITTPLFVVAAGLLVLATTWITARRGDRDPQLSLALWILLGLLIYPSSISFYSLLLIPILLLLWQRSDEIPGGVGSVAALASVVYVLTWARGGALTTVAYLLLWGICARLQAMAPPIGRAASDDRLDLRVSAT